jgi:hypothetical protein
MSKRNRLRKEAEAMKPVALPEGLKLGSHQFRPFTNLDCAFGADLKDYPPYEAIPDQFKLDYAPAAVVVSTLFFKGGKLDDFGLRLKAGVNRAAFFATLQSLLGSFAPKHEHKTAACAWLVDEFTEAA